MRILIKFVSMIVFPFLVGCGSVYTSPQVQKAGLNSDQNVKVNVVSLTEQSAYEANLSPYTPQRLPAVFSQVPEAGGLSGGRRLPTASLSPEFPPLPAQVILPSNPPLQPYQIGVSDVILLATSSQGTTVEELSGLLAAQNKRQGYTVQDDGAIAIPDIGRIQLAGLTLEEAEAAIFEALVSKNIEPSFSIEIAEFNSQRASIGGAVRNPTIVPITLKPLYLEEAVNLAGGVSAQDLDYVTIRLYRDGILYQVPAKELLNTNQRVRLSDRDSIFVDTEYQLDQAQAYFQEQIALAQLQRNDRAAAVSELEAAFRIRAEQLRTRQENFTKRLDLGAVKRQYVYVFGEVKTQRRVPMPFEQVITLADVLFDDGGLSTREADLSEIYVLRRSVDPREFGGVTAYHLNSKFAPEILTATLFEMRPNDIVFVSEQPITVWNRVITQITPSLISSTIGAASN